MKYLHLHPHLGSFELNYYLKELNLLNLIKYIRTTIFIIFLLGVSFDEGVAKNENTSHEKEEEQIDVGEVIFGHITNSHSWHVMDWKGKPVSIPLPIIIYHEEKGLDCFLSSKFEHGHASFSGYALKGSDIVAINENNEVNKESTAKLWDLSITKNVAGVFVCVALLIWIFVTIAKRYQKNPHSTPQGIQSLLEPVIIFVRDEIARSAIGDKKYHKYLPFLLTVFFFIWFSNLLGIIPIPPGGANLTGSLYVTGVLAVMTFLITVFSASKHYWKHIFAMPGVPKPVLLILTPIEFLQIFLKPIILIVRLCANITAGHIIMLSFICLIFIFGQIQPGIGYGVSIFSLVFSIFITLLELLVAFIQAYVFTFLSALYFGEALEEEH